MNYITIEEIKLQCRIDGSEEDELLITYGCAAEEYIINRTRRTNAELIALGGNGNIPYMIKAAILLLVAHLYKNREPLSSISQNRVPYAIEDMIRPYTRLTTSTN